MDIRRLTFRNKMLAIAGIAALGSLVSGSYYFLIAGLTAPLAPPREDKTSPVVERVENPLENFKTGITTLGFIGEEETLVDVQFNSEGRFGYIIAKDAGMEIVVSEYRPRFYDRIEDFYFSEDGKKFFYVAHRDGKKMLVIDGKEGRTYDDIYNPFFADDGKTYGYAAVRNGDNFMVINGRESRAYEAVELPLVLSPRPGDFAYRAKLGGKWAVVRESEEGKWYDEVDYPSFNPDGSEMAYSARIGNRWFLVINGREYKPYDYARFPVYSSEGMLAYAAGRGRNFFMVVDKVPQKSYAGLGASFGDFIFAGGTNLVYVAKKSSGYAVVARGMEGKTYVSVRNITLGPDGKSLGYIAEREPGFEVIVKETPAGRAEGSLFPSGSVENFRFSNSGRHVGYVVREGGRSSMVVEPGKNYGPYEAVSQPFFKTVNDEEYLTFGALNGRELIWFIEKVL